MNPSQLKHASEVMLRAAGGEAVERRLRFDSWDKRESCNDKNECWGFNWEEYEYRILGFPLPPDGQQWHNPAGLNATQVGVHEGWLPVISGHGLPHDAEMWNGFGWIKEHGCRPGTYGDYQSSGATFRTKSPLPSPKVDENDPGLKSFLAMSQAWVAFGKTPLGENATPDTFHGFCSAWDYAKSHLQKP